MSASMRKRLSIKFAKKPTTEDKSPTTPEKKSEESPKFPMNFGSNVGEA